MSDLLPDEKKTLEELQQTAKQAQTCTDVPEEVLEQMKKVLEDTKEQNAKGLKSTKLTRTRDITCTVNHIHDEVSVFLRLLCFH